MKNRFTHSDADGSCLVDIEEVRSAVEVLCRLVLIHL
jgi:hypothetical protein